MSAFAESDRQLPQGNPPLRAIRYRRAPARRPAHHSKLPTGLWCTSQADCQFARSMRTHFGAKEKSPRAGAGAQGHRFNSVQGEAGQNLKPTPPRISLSLSVGPVSAALFTVSTKFAALKLEYLYSSIRNTWFVTA